MNPSHVAQSIAASLEEGINARGFAILVVSGGSSPVPIFKSLSSMKLRWSQITVLLGDDRLVGKHHADSNERLVQKYLLINHASAASYLSLVSGADEILSLDLPFDIMLLGVGLDGHFASLFPTMKNLQDALDVSARPQILNTEILGAPAHERVSMNLSMILRSSRCLLIANSDDKRSIIKAGRINPDLPIYHLLNQAQLKIELI